MAKSKLCQWWSDHGILIYTETVGPYLLKLPWCHPPNMVKWDIMSVSVLTRPLILQKSPSCAASAINLAMSMEIINKSTPNQERKYRLSGAGCWFSKGRQNKWPAAVLCFSLEASPWTHPGILKLVAVKSFHALLPLLQWNLRSFVHSLCEYMGNHASIFVVPNKGFFASQEYYI